MNKRNPPGYWTYERCKEEALKYTKRADFINKSKGAYDVVMKNKWDKELLSHLTSPQRYKNFYTYENCKKIAFTFSKVSEFDKKEGTAYRAVLKNKWYDLLSHMEYKTTGTKRHIYAFEFSDNSVYVGLTYDTNKRKSSHLSDETSTVFKHFQKNNNYNFKVITKVPIPIKQAAKFEQKTIDEYKENGWKILNIAKAGGLGGSKKYWTYSRCKNETQKYKLMSDFYKNMRQSFRTILKKNGWWDELTSHIIEDRKIKKPIGYWQIKENCKNEAIKYSKKSQFENANGSAYNAACKNGWINEFFN